MRDPKEGVALAAIVAKETTEGSWSGVGTGLGLGTGGLGVFIGGMGGTKREQSRRANQFEAPPKSSFNTLYVLAPMISALVIGFVFKLGPSLVESTSESQTSDLATAQANFEQIVSVLVQFAPILACLFAVLWFMFGRKNREDAENARFKAAEAADRIKERVYYRLRYVESDHVVFDPKTGREVPAERNYILSLLDELVKIEK